MADTDDPLWPHFKPLWLEFEKAGKGVLVAGGYRDFFTGKDDWANEILRGRWLPEDLEVIQGILASWYKA